MKSQSDQGGQKPPLGCFGKQNYTKIMVMKEFTEKYDTNILKGVEYSYKAEDRKAALEFATFPNIEIYEDTGGNKSCDGEKFFENGKRLDNE